MSAIQEGTVADFGQEGYLEAYYFASDAGQETRTKLLDLLAHDVIRTFVALLSGPYGYLVFLEQEIGEAGFDAAFLELKVKIDALRDTVNPPTGSAAIPVQGSLSWPTRWSVKPKYGAFVRTRTEAGQAPAVLEAIQNLEFPSWGAAIVAGDFDILLEVDDDSLEVLADELLGQIQTISGVEWTETAFALNTPEEGMTPI